MPAKQIVNISNNMAMKLRYLIQPHYTTGIMYLLSTFTAVYAIDIYRYTLLFSNKVVIWIKYQYLIVV